MTVSKGEGQAPYIRHLYVSTYCLHHYHHRCRLFCKLCGADCQCHCHLEPTGEEKPDDLDPQRS